MNWAFILLFQLCDFASVISGDPYHTCPEYALENSILACKCQAKRHTNSRGTFYWKDGENRDLLTRNVRCADNNTHFTCVQAVGSQIQATVYTLIVVCGPQHDCPRYVLENTGFSCQCKRKRHDRSGQYYWKGQRTGGTLRRDIVKRKDDGTKFKCVRSSGLGYVVEVYTLIVAYGPTNDDITLTTSHPINVTDSRPLTFICEANNTNPTPTFAWGGVQCNHSQSKNRCDVDPSSLKYGSVVTCNVLGVNGWNNASAEYVVEYTMPNTTVAYTTVRSGFSKKKKIAIAVAIGAPTTVGFFGTLLWLIQDVFPAITEHLSGEKGEEEEEEEEEKSEEMHEVNDHPQPHTPVQSTEQNTDGHGKTSGNMSREDSVEYISGESTSSLEVQGGVSHEDSHSYA